MRILRKIQEKRDQNSNSNSATPLLPGTAAPDFTLPSTTGKPIQLSELNGRPVILVFYPADNSPVCSNQLALYNQALPLFKRHEAALIGISTDDPESHRGFAKSLNLAFPLLADNDPEGEVARAFGVYNEAAENAYRALYVVDKDGRISWQYISPSHINPGADGILTALEALEKKEI